MKLHTNTLKSLIHVLTTLFFQDQGQKQGGEVTSLRKVALLYILGLAPSLLSFSCHLKWGVLLKLSPRVAFGIEGGNTHKAIPITPAT
jgi:hypothetical protein